MGHFHGRKAYKARKKRRRNAERRRRLWKQEWKLRKMRPRKRRALEALAPSLIRRIPLEPGISIVRIIRPRRQPVLL